MTGNPVQVWLIPADLPDTVVAGFSGLLDDGERSRLDSIIQAAERRRFLAAHGGARTILAGLTGLPPGDLRFRAGDNGKPQLATGPPGLTAPGGSVRAGCGVVERNRSATPGGGAAEAEAA